MPSRLLSTPAIPVLLCVLAVPAGATPPGASVQWNLRLRQEQVDDAAFSQAATARTARLRLGVALAPAPGWSALVEAEGIAANAAYDSGANGRKGLPAVVDAHGAELNQAWLRKSAGPLAVTLGRQRIALDNQRWVGDVGWRQNQQTFDALALEWARADGPALRYAYLDRVHRVSGDRALDRSSRERALSTHLLGAGVRRAGQGFLAYGVLHRDRDVAAASSATAGVRWTGTRPLGGVVAGWTLEAARQRDHGDNPRRFSHGYRLVEGSIAARGVTARAGREHLGGDGSHALQTPLATLHAFNGWADKFLATPPSGLQDRYVALAGPAGPVRAGARATWQFAWHDYRATRGRGRHGSEWNASLGVPLAPGLAALVKLADYRADGHAADTRKLWLQLEYTGSR